MVITDNEVEKIKKIFAVFWLIKYKSMKKGRKIVENKNSFERNQDQSTQGLNSVWFPSLSWNFHYSFWIAFFVSVEDLSLNFLSTLKGYNVLRNKRFCNQFPSHFQAAEEPEKILNFISSLNFIELKIHLGYQNKK